MKGVSRSEDPAGESVFAYSLVFRCFVLFVIHFLSAGVGITLLTHPERVVAFWPPTGLLLGVLIMVPRSDRLPLALTATVSCALAYLIAGKGWEMSSAFAIIHSAEALVASLFLEQFCGSCRFSSLRQALVFIIVAFTCSAFFAFLFTLASATIFTSLDILFWNTWHVAMASDAISMLAVVPIVVAWLTPTPGRTSNLGQLQEKIRWGALLAATLFVAEVVFSGSIPQLSGHPAATYLLFPLLAWAAISFGLRGMSSVSLILTLIAVWSASQSVGLFAPYPSDAYRVLLVQEFLGVHLLSSLVFTAILEERRRLQRAKDQAYIDLAKSHIELKSTQIQLIQAEKMKSVGRLAAGTAHEVLNPLATILMGVDYLKNRQQDSEASKPDVQVLVAMKEAVGRADTIIRGVLDFSSDSKLNRMPLNVRQLLSNSVELVRNELTRNHIIATIDCKSDLPKISGDEQKLRQVFVNLFMNAIESMKASGALTVIADTYVLSEIYGDLSEHFGSGNSVVRVRVQDTGPGVPREIQDKIFDPFFTTHAPGQGVGLGLSIVRTILTLHEALVRIDNSAEGGAEVCVFFPVIDSKPTV